MLRGDVAGAEIAAKAHSMRSGAEIVAYLREKGREKTERLLEIRTPL